VLDGGQHELVLVGPAAVEHCDSGLGSRGDRLHRQAGVADLDQLIPGSVEQCGFELLSAPAVADGLRRWCDHISRLERFAFLSKGTYPP
jgi:hypothetical protein